MCEASGVLSLKDALCACMYAYAAYVRVEVGVSARGRRCSYALEADCQGHRMAVAVAPAGAGAEEWACAVLEKHTKV